jgi:hypothetical protein
VEKESDMQELLLKALFQADRQGMEPGHATLLIVELRLADELFHLPGKPAGVKPSWVSALSSRRTSSPAGQAGTGRSRPTKIDAAAGACAGG